MNLQEMANLLEAEFIAGSKNASREIRMVCGCDLLSDVLAFIKADALLLTGLTNVQVVRTAEMSDISGICFVRGKRPPAETIKLAETRGLPLLTTKLSMYESCGRLHRKGVSGCDEA